MESKRKLLIVEDDIDLLEVLYEILTKHFDVVIKATDAISAYIALQDEKPDFIIADIKMPGMDGIEFISKIRSEGLAIPVIICSASPSAEDLKKAMSLGISDFVEKPFTIEAIETAVFRMIEIRKKSSDVQKLKILHGNESKEEKKQERITSMFQAANAVRNSK